MYEYIIHMQEASKVPSALESPDATDGDYRSWMLREYGNEAL